MTDSPDHWMDDELRNVPLPAGLRARLREIIRGDEAALDLALCDVPIPQGLLARLKGVPHEVALDGRLTDVAVPSGLADRLKQIPEGRPAKGQPLEGQPLEGPAPQPATRAAASAPPAGEMPLRGAALAAALADAVADDTGDDSRADALLDAALRDVSLPVNLTAPLHEIPRAMSRPLQPQLVWLAEQLPRMSAAQWAVAASLLVATWSALLGGLWGVAALARHTPQPAPALASGGPLELAIAPVDDELYRDVVLFAGPTDASAAVAVDIDVEPLDGLTAPLRGGPLTELTLLFAAAEFDPLLRVGLVGSTLIAAETSDAMPLLARVTPPVRHGVAPPRVKEFDMLRLVKEGVHPFVTPDAHASLHASQVPLVTSTASFDAFRRDLDRNVLPAAATIRTEEFLAALDYGFPPPEKGSLAIRTGAGPSPFGEPELSLLLVGVQAADPTVERPATHLILAVDVSTSMERSGRLDQIRRAVGRFMQALGGDDRISLVTFARQAELVVEGAGAADFDSVTAALGARRGSVATNLGAGLQTATVAAKYAAADDAAQRVVLLTDGLGDLPAEVVNRLADLAATAGAPVDVIDVGHEPDRRLGRLTRAAGGKLHRALDAAAVHFALRESLSGAAQDVAADARLRVRFNPRSVARYRLLGHEADLTEGIFSATESVVLRADEAAAALFELQLKPGGPDDVAVAELTWRDPQGGAVRRLTQRISRLQFAISLLESPLALQQAAIAAETAELLRGSPYAPGNARGLGNIVQVAGRLSPRTRLNRSFLELMSVVEQAERVRAGKPAAAEAR